MRSLCMLPGGLGRFVPCSIGVNHYRLCHVGWEKCGHGLTSRPQERASAPFFGSASAAFFTTLLGLLVPCLLVLFPCGIVLLSFLLEHLFGICLFLAMLLSRLLLRIMLLWLVRLGLIVVVLVFLVWSRFGKKRFRLNRKTPAHLVVSRMHARPRVWKRLHCFGSPGVSDVVRGGDTISVVMVAVLFIPGLVWVDLGIAQAHVSGLHEGISF